MSMHTNPFYLSYRALFELEKYDMGSAAANRAELVGLSFGYHLS